MVAGNLFQCLSSQSFACWALPREQILTRVKICCGHNTGKCRCDFENVPCSPHPVATAFYRQSSAIVNGRASCRDHIVTDIDPCKTLICIMYNSGDCSVHEGHGFKSERVQCAMHAPCATACAQDEKSRKASCACTIRTASTELHAQLKR